LYLGLNINPIKPKPVRPCLVSEQKDVGTQFTNIDVLQVDQEGHGGPALKYQVPVSTGIKQQQRMKFRDHDHKSTRYLPVPGYLGQVCFVGEKLFNLAGGSLQCLSLFFCSKFEINRAQSITDNYQVQARS
jgi:hypothetical protein